MKKLFVIAIAAVLTFTGSTVYANTSTVQTKSTTVATEPTCCCVYVNILGHQILHLKTKKIKARIRVLT